jgi:hypothetical protein
MYARHTHTYIAYYIGPGGNLHMKFKKEKKKLTAKTNNSFPDFCLFSFRILLIHFRDCDGNHYFYFFLPPLCSILLRGTPFKN